MRDEDKPYACYKQGWSIKIVPRNGEGWRGVGLWVVGLLALLGGFIGVLASASSETLLITAVAVFLVATLVWVFAMIRWMMARSEVVDVEDLLRLKRERDQTRRRRS